ncbi:MAG: hypothetical protein WDO68_04290 [Gammaproteobacteria bacterium]
MSVTASDIQSKLSSTLTLQNSGAPALQNSESAAVSAASKGSSSEGIPSVPVQWQSSARTTPNNLAWVQAEMKALHKPLTVLGGNESLRQEIDELSVGIDKVVKDFNESHDIESTPVLAYVERNTAKKSGSDASSRTFTAYPLLSSPCSRELVAKALHVVTEVSNLVSGRDMEKANESRRAACVRILKTCARVLLAITVATVVAAVIVAGTVALAHFFAPTALVACLIVAVGTGLASWAFMRTIERFARPTDEDRKETALEVLRESASKLLEPIRDAHALPGNQAVEHPIDPPQENLQASNPARTEHGDV